jgi:20S proteasome subunit beta 6
MFVCLAVAGKDFVICCTDTRISSGYSILKRNHKKTTKLTETCMITSGGMVADIDALHKNLLTRIRIYKMQNKREPSPESIAKLLSNTLYGRRFMPFYAFNLLAGLDATTGEGIIYGYDAIGSYQPVNYGCLGSGR